MTPADSGAYHNQPTAAMDTPVHAFGTVTCKCLPVPIWCDEETCEERPHIEGYRHQASMARVRRIEGGHP